MNSRFRPLLMALTLILPSLADAAGNDGPTLLVETGLAWDNNVYLSPAGPYIDYGQTTPLLVTPKVQQGFFVPLSLDAGYAWSASDKHLLQISFTYNTQHYLDSGLSNANRHDYTFTVGDSLMLDKTGASRLLLEAFRGAYRKIYVDRDTGLEKDTSSGSDVSNRYQYDNTGARMRWQWNGEMLDFKLYGTWQLRDYADPGVISQLDHTYYQLKGSVFYHQSKQTRYGLRYGYYVYDYVERPARDAAGFLRSANPSLVYQYRKLSADFRHKLNKAWKFNAGLDYTARTDNFQGYGNYTENAADIAVRYRIKKGVEAKLKINRWLRDYPYAYAFDNVLQGPKKADGNEADLSLEFSLPGKDTITLQLSSRKTRGTDARYEYERKVAGLRYELKL